MTPITANPIDDSCSGSGWRIRISFTIFSYQQSDQYWVDHLDVLILETFRVTILLSFDSWQDSWCTAVFDRSFNVDFNNGNRRLLQSTSDINVELAFDVNEDLYQDYFQNYNKTEFADEYRKNLAAQLAKDDPTNPNLNVGAFTVSDPIPDITPSPTSISAPATTRETISGQMILVIFVLCFGFCIILVCISFKCWYDSRQKEQNVLNISKTMISMPTSPNSLQQPQDGDGYQTVTTRSPDDVALPEMMTMDLNTPNPKSPSVVLSDSRDSQTQTQTETVLRPGIHPFSPSFATAQVVKDIMRMRFIEMENINATNAEQVEAKYNGDDAMFTPMSHRAGDAVYDTPGNDDLPALLDGGHTNTYRQDQELEVIFNEMMMENQKKKRKQHQDFQIVMSNEWDTNQFSDSEEP